MTMILINLYQQFRSNTFDKEKKEQYSRLIHRQIEEFFPFFYKEEHKAVLEFSALDGSLLDSPEGREINPGHAIKTAWFILEETRLSRNQDHRNKALKIIDWSLESGWDKEFGGLISFIDMKSLPSLHVEWDMKYWWPHTEALYALLLAYNITKDVKYASWYEKMAEYTFSHFADPDPNPENGREWYGYLHRDAPPSPL